MERVLRQDCKQLFVLRRFRLSKDSIALCEDSIVGREKEIVKTAPAKGPCTQKHVWLEICQLIA